MTRLQDKTFGYPPLTLSSDPRVCFTLGVFFAKIPELWLQGEGTSTNTKYLCTQGHPAPETTQEKSTKSDKMGTQWKSRPFHIIDASPFVLVLLHHPKFWHPDFAFLILPSERNRQAGIQHFPSRLCPLPMIFLCLPHSLH